MCRHLAWLGAERTVADLVLDQPTGLLHQSYAPARQLRGVVNADGWGVGFFHAEQPAPVRWRSSRPLWSEASIVSVAPVLRSGAVVAAVRSASAGMPMDETAAAPFTDGTRLLSHNGRLDRTVLPPTHDAESTCDSAVLAAHVFARLDAGEGLADVVADVARLDPGASLNLLVVEADRLTAVSWVDPMSYLVTDDGVAVASEPYDEDPRWVDLSTHHLLEAVRDPGAPAGVRVSERALDPARAARPGPSRPAQTHPGEHPMSVDLDVRLDPATLVDQMADDVRAGLGSRPYTLPPKYFYDAEGSVLFDEITRLEEYYPTRTERSILVGTVTEIADLTRARSLIELGSGTSEKTRLLLQALTSAGTLAQFVPFDVDPAILRVAAEQVKEEFPGLTVSPVVGDFDHHLRDLPGEGPRLMAFLGSTLGNFDPGSRTRFFSDVRGVLGDGDHLLLGVDLVKDPDRLVAAYDDARGVTAAFNTNVLHVLNREQKADFDVDSFTHVAVWDAENEWIEMRLRSEREQRVRIESLDLDVQLAAGEEIRTEISAKFRREGLEAELAAAGLAVRQWWTDPSGDFALTLVAPA